VSNDVDIMTGVAALLDTAGIGVYDAANGPPPTGLTLPWIRFKEMPDAPDRCIVITAYSYANQPRMALDQPRLQIRCRGARDDAFDVDEITGQVFDALHGLTYVTWGGVAVHQVLQQSRIPMGVDSDRRWELSDNYLIDADVPATANRPD
jgi:hypothetical protein